VSHLYEVYQELGNEQLREKIQKLEELHGVQKYGEAWRVLNEMTGRKRTKEGQVNGSSPEERTNTWFTAFQELA